MPRPLHAISKAKIFFINSGAVPHFLRKRKLKGKKEEVNGPVMFCLSELILFDGIGETPFAGDPWICMNKT